MIETYRGVVYPNQLDHMGHMNVQWYTSKFDEATWHFFSHLGITNNYITVNKKVWRRWSKLQDISPK